MLLGLLLTTLLCSCSSTRAVQNESRKLDQTDTETYILLAADHTFDAALEDKVQTAIDEAAPGSRGRHTVAKLARSGLAVAENLSAEEAQSARKVPGIAAVAKSFHLSRLPRRKVQQPTDNRKALSLQQWAVSAIDLARSHSAGHKGGGARVAVLDTGFYTRHRSLAGYDVAASKSLVPGEDLNFNKSRSGGERFSHGTHVASVSTGRTVQGGTVGVAPEAQLVLIKTLADSGEGQDAWTIAGIIYAASIGVDVINLSQSAVFDTRGDSSGGTYTSRDVTALRRVYAEAVRFAAAQGAVVVASTGNEFIDFNSEAAKFLVQLPASVPGVIGVTGTGPFCFGQGGECAAVPPQPDTSLDHFGAYNNYGSTITDLSAPGGIEAIGDQAHLLGVVAACCPGTGRSSYGWEVGTSQAAAHVTGVAALLVGKAGRRVTPSELKRALAACSDDPVATGDYQEDEPGYDSKYGVGRINAGKVADIVL